MIRELKEGQVEWQTTNDDLLKSLKEIERKRKNIERIQEALATSKDHADQQDYTARLRAKLVETKKSIDELETKRKLY